MSQDQPNCIICQKQRGAFVVPGGPIYQDDLFMVWHAYTPQKTTHWYLGWLFVELRRHVPELADLTDAEAAQMGLLIARISRVLMSVVQAEHVYCFVMGDGVPHVHLQILPRYPGAPREYWGVHVDEWPDAPHGDADAISTLAGQLREALASPP